MVRVGIVGAGGIATEHLQVLTARRDVEVLAIVDRSAATAALGSATLAGGRVVHGSPRAAGGPARRRARSHAAPDTRGRRATPSKPEPTSSPRSRLSRRAELQELHELAETVDRWLLEDQNYRWNDGVLWLSHVVESGRLGEVRDVEVAMALAIRAGGVFADRHLPSLRTSSPAARSTTSSPI